MMVQVPIKPAREGERRIMVAALAEARQNHPADSRAVYDEAATRYLMAVELAYSDPSSRPLASASDRSTSLQSSCFNSSQGTA